ncbi:MAG: ubiquinone biosynthesis regulatory protein kinase UbiB, partial [Xanthomonadales bacterium]|nr:ubiquinone biosynthesis regulatory protein kinase UbiB [Xanthomonadales bacterium]
QLLVRLFQVAHRFDLTIQPQLIMLQKTLLNIEGLGRELYPQLDIWAVAKPELEAIMAEKQGLDATARELRDRLPGWLSKAPEMPGLIHEYLSQATRGQLVTRMRSPDLEQLREDTIRYHRRALLTFAGGLLGIAAAVLLGLEAGPGHAWGLSLPGLLTGVTSVWLLLRAWRS